MNFQEILRIVAQKNHTSPEEVERAMGEAIALAWRSTSPKSKAVQERIFPTGGLPTPEEFVLAIAEVAAGEVVTEGVFFLRR